jgi:hypothetical protein
MQFNEMFLSPWVSINRMGHIVGLVLRTKLRCWRIWLPWILKSLSFLSHHLLYFISGDKYTYEVLFYEETLNGQIISSNMEGRVGRGKEKAEVKEEDKEAIQIDFFGNKVPQWAIVFYSVLHLCFWFYLKHFGIQTDKIEKFFSNNLLLVLYVIVSFWIIGTVVPMILKNLVKYGSTFAFHITSKSIKV